MPRKTDTLPIADPFMDRRTKLLPCQKEMVHYWYAKGHSINGIARMFHVNKRSIHFLLFPERLRKNLSDRQDRGGTMAYYKKDYNTEAIKEHRKYKAVVLKPIVHQTNTHQP